MPDADFFAELEGDAVPMAVNPRHTQPIEVDAAEFDKDPLKWMRQASGDVAVNVLRDGVLTFSVGGNFGGPDPRDIEIAALRAQLVDAEVVMSAMREDLEESVQYAPEYFRDKWDLGSSLKLLASYDAKHKEPAKPKLV